MRTIQVHLEDSLGQEVDRAATALGTTPAHLTQEILRAALEEPPRNEELTASLEIASEELRQIQQALAEQMNQLAQGLEIGRFVVAKEVLQVAVAALRDLERSLRGDAEQLVRESRIPWRVPEQLAEALSASRNQSLEQQHRAGYERQPVTLAEFGDWEEEQVWPD